AGSGRHTRCWRERWERPCKADYRLSAVARPLPMFAISLRVRARPEEMFAGGSGCFPPQLVELGDDNDASAELNQAVILKFLEVTSHGFSSGADLGGEARLCGRRADDVRSRITRIGAEAQYLRLEACPHVKRCELKQTRADTPGMERQVPNELPGIGEIRPDEFDEPFRLEEHERRRLVGNDAHGFMRLVAHER